MTPATIVHLSRSDKKLARLIRKIGPLEFKPAKKRTPFAALTRAVIGQQLSGAAATSIFKRLAGLLPSGVTTEHDEVLQLSDEILKDCQLKKSKKASSSNI